MGTDVYLEWQGKKDEPEQTASSSVEVENDYLRASIHMVAENGVLRMLFAEKYWLKRSKDEYDFKGNYEMLKGIGLKYLVSVAAGKPMKLPEEVSEVLKRQEKSAAAIMGALKRIVGDKEGVSVSCGSIEDFGEAVKWLNSLFSFFELGIEKQEKGFKPYPYISW